MMMFSMFSIRRSLKCVLTYLESVSLTNKLADGFNAEFLITIGTGTGTTKLFGKISTESDREITTRSTREITTELTIDSIESCEFKAAVFFFFLFGLGLDLVFFFYFRK